MIGLLEELYGALQGFSLKKSRIFLNMVKSTVPELHIFKYYIYQNQKFQLMCYNSSVPILYLL